MLVQVENRMVVDSEWKQRMSTAVREKLRGPGYEEVGTGMFVPEEDAFRYALERVSRNEEEKKEFLEWFYSSWIKEDLGYEWI